MAVGHGAGFQGELPGAEPYFQTQYVIRGDEVYCIVGFDAETIVISFQDFGYRSNPPYPPSTSIQRRQVRTLSARLAEFLETRTIHTRRG
jgi:hypothetical protein